MKHYILSLILIILPASQTIFAQKAYLDSNFGVDGIRSIPAKGSPFLYSGFYADEDNKIKMIISDIYQSDEVDSVLMQQRYLKLSTDGNKVEKEHTHILTEPGLWYLRPLLRINNEGKTLRITPDTTVSQGIDLIEWLDEDLAVIKSFDIMVVNELYWLYFLYTDISRIIDSKDRLVIANMGYIHRYLEENKLDNSFGNNGIVTILPAMNNVDSLYSSAYSRIVETADGGYVTNSFQTNYNNDTLAYRSYVHKVSADGTIDSDYNKIGYYPFDDNEIVYEIIRGKEEVYYFHSTRNLLDSCEINIGQSKLTRLRSNGELDAAWSDNGVSDNQSLDLGCYDSNSYNIVGPNNEVLRMFHEYSIDSSGNTLRGAHKLIKLDSSGSLDISFGESGILYLDDVPGSYITDVSQGPTHDLFILSVDTIGNQEIDTNYYHITKLKANKLWNLPEEQLGPDSGQYTIYPNPTSEGITLSYEGPELEMITVEILDLLGRLESIHTFSIMIDQFEIYLDTNPLSSGQYIISIRSNPLGSVIHREKFIKIN